MMDHFSLVLLGFVILTLLYSIFIMNGRQFRYFKYLLEDERRQNSNLWGFFNDLISDKVTESAPTPGECRTFHRSNRAEKMIEDSRE